METAHTITSNLAALGSAPIDWSPGAGASWCIAGLGLWALTLCGCWVAARLR